MLFLAAPLPVYRWGAGGTGHPRRQARGRPRPVAREGRGEGPLASVPAPVYRSTRSWFDC